MSNLQAPPFVAAYDLSDDRERRRVATLLEGYGFRVQFSVFECRLTRANRQRLTRQIESLGLRSGHVRLYRLYDAARHEVIGSPQRPSADQCHAFCV